MVAPALLELECYGQILPFLGQGSQLTPPLGPVSAEKEGKASAGRQVCPPAHRRRGSGERGRMEVGTGANGRRGIQVLVQTHY